MTRPTGLKAVFFDIDDTLYSTTDFARRARHNALKAMIRLGLDLPLSVLIREFDEVISEFLSNYERHFDKLLLRIPGRYYKSVNPAILVAGAVIAYHQTKYRELKPYPDVVKALTKLSKTDIIRGVITAGLAVKQSEKLIRLGLYRYLTPGAIFISEQIGIGKPNIKLYQRACDEAGVRPEQALYVGDHPFNDIDPANKIGMITVLNRRNNKLLSVKGRTSPDYRINDFRQLLKIIKRYKQNACAQNRRSKPPF
ncbi:MAG: TIGR02253 family HAD-type hydrolase [Candidatus Brocadiia bacterium]